MARTASMDTGTAERAETTQPTTEAVDGIEPSKRLQGRPSSRGHQVAARGAQSAHSAPFLELQMAAGDEPCQS